MKVNNNLKQIIDEKGIKQKYLAEKAGISEQTLSNLIKNRHDISLRVAFQISYALGVPIEEIFSLDRVDLQDDSEKTK